MQLILNSRNELAGNAKLQLNFVEVQAVPEAPAVYPTAGAQLSGWFDREEAMQYTVGAVYELTLTPVA